MMAVTETDIVYLIVVLVFCGAAIGIARDRYRVAVLDKERDEYLRRYGYDGRGPGATAAWRHLAATARWYSRTMWAFFIPPPPKDGG